MDFHSPKYATADNRSIDIFLVHPDHGGIPYTVTAEDAPDLWRNALLASPAPYEPLPTSVMAALMREERDARMLRDVDPWVTNPLRWGDLSAARQDVIKAYRRALLDVPEQPGFPHDIQWPVMGNI